jgi:hypothetical protein
MGHPAVIFTEGAVSSPCYVNERGNHFIRIQSVCGPLSHREILDTSANLKSAESPAHAGLFHLSPLFSNMSVASPLLSNMEADLLYRG